MGAFFRERSERIPDYSRLCLVMSDFSDLSFAVILFLGAEYIPLCLSLHI